MSVTVPDWADTLLDLIGVAWPNVDEDAYRDMADSLREFAEDLLDDGQLANNHVERLLSASKGESIEALNKHWNTVKTKHFKDLASAARTIAGAMDLAADAVVAMKSAALVQLGYLATEAGIALSLIPVTGGLSMLIGAGAMRATQEVVKRLIKECMEEAVGYIVSAMTEPAVAALEGMAADLVVQLGSMALGFQDGVDLDQAKNAGKDGFKEGVQSGKESLHLASAGGGGGSGLVDLHIEHSEHDRAGTHLNTVSTGIHGKTTSKLTKAKSHHGRTRGRDSIAQAIDPVADKALAALTKATKAMGDHVGTTLPKAVKQISTDHKKNDQALHDDFNRLKKDSGAGGKDGGGGGGKPPTGGGGGGGGGGTGGGGGGGRPLDPQPASHGRSSAGMKHHRRDALDVSHLDEQQRHALLRHEASQLSESAQAARGQQPPGKERLKSGCSGAFLHDDIVTSHSSSQRYKDGQENPRAHPVVQDLYDDIARRADNGEFPKGRGHGRCAEVSLVSDRLHQMQSEGRNITNIDEAREALKGSVMHTVTIGEQFDEDNNKIPHNSYIPPCQSCKHAMPALGISLLS